MDQVFAKVMSIVWALYTLESPFFGLTYFQIVGGLLILRLCVMLMHDITQHGYHDALWGDKKYKHD